MTGELVPVVTGAFEKLLLPPGGLGAALKL